MESTISPAINTSPQPSTVAIPQKNNIKIKLFFLFLGLIFVITGVAFGSLFTQSLDAGPKVKLIVGSFMQSVSSGDLNNAYALTSTEFQKSLPRADFDSAMNTFGAQYSGYKEQKQTGFSIQANVGEPTIYKYSGEITYEDGDKGEVEASLVKEANDWKIVYIKVDIDIKRMQKYQQATKESVLGVSTTNK